MDKIEWTAEYELGIAVIDGQHRRIVDYINQLEDAVERQDRAAVGEVLHQLLDYTQSHFAFEEALLEEVDYGHSVPHQRTHAAFTRRIAEVQGRYAAGEAVASDLLTLLRTWLVEHIQGEDARYAQVVHERFLARGRYDQISWVGRTVRRIFG